MAAGSRLLQQQPTTMACDCPPTPTSQQPFGSISPGGVVALCLFIGIAIGSISTVLIQCWRRRRELRYMDKGSNVRQSVVAMQALPAAPRTPCGTQQPLSLPAPSAAPSVAQGSVAGSTQGGGANSKYFSPLNTNKGLMHQLSEMRSSMHYSDNGGDTHSVAASDQHAPRDKNSAMGGGGQVLHAQQRPRDFSQHGMRLQQGHSGNTPGAAGAAAWGTAGHNHPQQGSAAGPPQGEGLMQGSSAYGGGAGAGTQVPQEVSSSMLSADGPLQPEDSSPTPTRPAAAAARGQLPLPSPRQQAQLLSSPVRGGAPASAAALGSSPRPARSGNSDQQHQQQASSPAATTVTEIEDEYEESDLDEDWRALLGGVDARLRAQGARPLNARERAIAIKKLLVSTGTRGVEFALNTTLQEVLNFRQIHGQ